LLQSAKDGSRRLRTSNCPAPNCATSKDTRSYGCMWSFEKVGGVCQLSEDAVSSACFPAISPRQSHMSAARSIWNTISGRANH
jgi:hypothetical protein